MLERELNRSRQILQTLRTVIPRLKRLMTLFTLKTVMMILVILEKILWLTKTLRKISWVFVSPSSARHSHPFM